MKIYKNRSFGKNYWKCNILMKNYERIFIYQKQFLLSLFLSHNPKYTIVLYKNENIYQGEDSQVVLRERWPQYGPRFESRWPPSIKMGWKRWPSRMPSVEVYLGTSWVPSGVSGLPGLSKKKWKLSINRKLFKIF